MHLAGQVNFHVGRVTLTNHLSYRTSGFENNFPALINVLNKADNAQILTVKMYLNTYKYCLRTYLVINLSNNSNIHDVECHCPLFLTKSTFEKFICNFCRFIQDGGRRGVDNRTMAAWFSEYNRTNVDLVQYI